MKFKLNNYFENYKKTNLKKLSKYILNIDNKIDKYTNYKYPFNKGNYEIDYISYLEKCKLNYESLTPNDSFEYLSKYIQNTPNWNNPGTMINVIPPINLVAASSAFVSEMFNPNFAQDTYSGNLILSELEVAKYMSDLIGWNWKDSYGFFTFGGTGTNLYGNKLALVNADIKSGKEGVTKGKYFLLTSSNGHPCHYQLCDWLGIGSDSCIEIPCLKNGEIDLEVSKKIIEENIENGKVYLGFNLNGGSTNEMIIDPVKEVYDLHKYIKKKYKLSYNPTIHVDSVLGWVYLFFNEYNFQENNLEIPKKYLKIVKSLNKKIKNLKYADTIGIDFHKTGFCPYVTSMLLVKDKKLFNKLNPEKNITTEDMKYGNYNPYQISLEYSRSAHGPIAALMCLKSLGISGFQKIVSDLIVNTSYFREKLKENSNVCMIFEETEGFATMFALCPPEIGKFSEKDLYNMAKEKLSIIREYNINFSKKVMLDAIENKTSFFFTSSRSYVLPGSDINVGTLKAYPMSVFLNKEEVDRIIKELNNSIKQFIEKSNVVYDNKEIFDDMSKAKKN